MADEKVKKVILAKESLPPINSDEDGYIVRYRVVSEDRNRSSHWSPQVLLSPVPLTESEFFNISISAIPSSGILLANWEYDEKITNPIFDIYVAWGTQQGAVGLDTYYATVSGNTATIPVPAGKTYAQVFIQTMSYPRKRMDSITIAKTGIFSTSSGV